MKNLDVKLIGRAGKMGRGWSKKRQAYDKAYGRAGWVLVHCVGGVVLDFVSACQLCEEAYLVWLRSHAELVELLTTMASDVYANATSNVRSACDYSVQERKREHVQDIAVRNALRRLGQPFRGEKLVRISGVDAFDERLCWEHISFHRPELIYQPSLMGPWEPESIASFWYSNRMIALRN